MEDGYVVPKSKEWPMGIKIGDRITIEGKRGGVVVGKKEWKANRKSPFTIPDLEGAYPMLMYRSDKKSEGYYHWNIFLMVITKIERPEHMSEKNGQLLMF